MASTGPHLSAAQTEDLLSHLAETLRAEQRVAWSKETDDDAQDVACQALEALLNGGRAGSREAISDLQAYCATAFIHRQRNHYREQARWERVREEFSRRSAIDYVRPVDIAMQAELAAIIRKALARLPGIQQRIFTLHVDFGLRVPAIARFFHEHGEPLSRSAVESHLKYARSRLRQVLLPLVRKLWLVTVAALLTSRPPLA